MIKKSFWLTKELVREIERIAKASKETQSEVVRKALYKYFPKI